MGTIPFSNPAGNNQMSPPGLPKMNSSPVGNIPGSPSQTQNPYMPPSPTGTGGPIPLTNLPGGAGSGGPTSSAQNGFITPNSSYSSRQNDLSKQLTDIYGKGVGGSIFELLNNMSGTNSTILQEYIQSLQPQMATAQANTNAALGAGGVGANSSVEAIADSNLQAQEFSSIAGESASLTQSQEQMTLQTLMGMSKDASKEVASSGWGVLGDVLNAGEGLASTVADFGNPFSRSGTGTNAVPAPPQTSTDYSLDNITIPFE
jgi:hypothetical protein